MDRIDPQMLDKISDLCDAGQYGWVTVEPETAIEVRKWVIEQRRKKDCPTCLNEGTVIINGIEGHCPDCGGE